MAVKASSRSSRNAVQLARPTLRETIARLAPGTALRDGLERILRGRTGALIVIGYDDSVEGICGFRNPSEVRSTRSDHYGFSSIPLRSDETGGDQQVA
jgi:hypothetical protein